MSFTVQGARDAVRTLVRDGMPSTALHPYGIVRQEQLSDQIPAVPTPTQTTFYVRFASVPLGKNVTVQAVPGTIAAYRDGVSIPDTLAGGWVTSDIDFNGGFTLAHPPVSGLLVSYGWQLLADSDLDELVDTARSWLYAWASIGLIPDGCNPALSQYAAGLACRSIARQCRLAKVGAGDAREDLSDVADGYEKDASDFLKRAETARASYWTSADQPKSPAAAIGNMNYPNYQPRR